MLDLGFVKPGRTIRIPFSSFAGSTGASSATSGNVVGDIVVYKDGSTTERASTSGYTFTVDFDTKTGLNVVIIDLADNTTADFFQAGSEYLVGVADVTVDTQTVRFWLARFVIGLPEAVLNTWIATLSSQTSFTLNEGPAEDNALKGCRVYIHDAASAVQGAFGVITAYTGATKTVTLAAGPTFTIAAKDNLMVLAPVDVYSIGGTAQTAGDIYARLGAPAGASMSVDIAAIKTDTGNLTSRITSTLFSGITSMANWLGAIAGKQAADATAQTEIRATGAGSGTFTATTDSLEALRDQGDSAWATVTAANIRSAVGLASANLDTQLSTIAGYIDTEVASILAAVDTEVGAIKTKTDQLTFTALNQLDVQVLAMANNVITAASINTAAITAAKFASGAIDATALDSTAANEIRDSVWAKTLTELTGVPGATAAVLDAVCWLFMQARNKRETDSALGTDKVYNDAGSAIATATITDAASVFTRGEYA